MQQIQSKHEYQSTLQISAPHDQDSVSYSHQQYGNIHRHTVNRVIS